MIAFKTKVSIALNFLKVRLLGKRVPLLVGWAVTGRCNRNCFYCNARTCGRELNEGEALSLLDQLAVAGTKLVQFTGGEPLLREDIGRLVRYAKSKGLMVNLSSNGTFVPERIDEIAAVDVLNLSLEGPQDVHDAMRGQGSHPEVMRALEAARKSGLKVRLCATLAAMNLDVTDYLSEIAREYSVRVLFQPAIAMKRQDGQTEAFAASPEAFQRKIDDLIARKKQGAFWIGNSLSSLHYFMSWPEKKDIFCGAGLAFCRIEPDGTLYPCSRTVRADYAVPYCRNFTGSFLKLANVRCKACWANSLLEANLLLALDPRSMIASLKGVP